MVLLTSVADKGDLPASRSGHFIQGYFRVIPSGGPGAHATSCAMTTVYLSLRQSGWGRGVDHPPTSNAEVKERVELYFYCPFGPL